MSRRVRTLVVTGVLLLVALVAMERLPVPYVVLSPGITLNTLGTDSGKPIIAVTGGPVRATTGHLNLTTVSVTTQRINPLQALVGWLRHDQIVVPRAAVFPPGQSEQQVNQQNTADFVDSQSSAEAAALCELGYPKGFGVLSLSSAAAKSVLKVGDALVSLNGAAVSSAETLTAVLADQTPGAGVSLVVTRAGQPVTVQLVLSKPSDGHSGASIGIGVGQACLAPYAVSFGLDDQIGGPSAGLMFALGLIDKIGPSDVTDGRFIAGTGTIDASGRVGAIGGIQLKMIAARRAGASVFLAPAANCPDVRGNVPDGLDVVQVSTLHDALADLETLQRGGAVSHC